MLRVSPIVSVLISIWLETLIYGINIAAYVFSLYILLKRPSVNLVVLILSTALFVSATGHMAINLCRLVQGYIQPPTKAAMLVFLYDLTVKTNVAKQYFLVMVNLFSDILLTWRVYMVWERNWKVTTIPATLCAATFTSGIVTAIYESIVQPGQTIFLKRISHWASAQFSLSLAMNLTTTLLIASRIWYVTREVREFSPEKTRAYKWVVVVLVESASVAAFAQIVQLAFYESKFPGIFFISDGVVQVVTMAPLIIIVLVGVRGTNKGGVLGTSYHTSETAMSDMRFDSHIAVELQGQSRSTHGDLSAEGGSTVHINKGYAV
ncbi:hypothetical protein BDZ94DRAFT_1171491 [Collybia nuda]|uniref:Uncharacterized protein n=1 Tax=Collybia nuda TaxID=64659 RepID=A0A9P5XZG4_9AGAR|nr:hypothetical protein BDZ94DRAFT_1171491 [Collybia nuda]